MVDRAIAGGIALIAAVIGLRAAWILWIVLSVQNMAITIPRSADGCPVCAAPTTFTAETEQILIILGSLVVLAGARLLWRRGAA